MSDTTTRRRLLGAVLGTAAITTVALADGPLYTVTELGPVARSGPPTTSEAATINNLGQAAGISTIGVDQSGTTLWLPTPAYGLPAGPNFVGGFRAYGMNDLGQVVGFTGNPLQGNDPVGTFWDPVEGMTQIQPFGGNLCIAYAVNNAGLVVGESTTDDPDVYRHAFVWDGSQTTDLGTFGGIASRAYDINEAGQVVGVSWYDDGDPWDSRIRAMLWLPEPAYGLPAGLHDIDDVSTVYYQTTQAQGINDHGQIAGWLSWLNELGQTVVQAGIWLPEPAYGLPAGWTDLRGIGGIRGTAFAQDINNRGEIVVRADRDPSNPFGNYTAAVWRQGVWYDLNFCISPAEQVAWEFGSATDINDRGEIVGWGYHYGQWRGFLLTPMLEEPSCPADADGDGETGFNDLLLILSTWGPCEGCPADLDENGAVDFNDLLQVLSTWGPCPGTRPGACCFPVTGDCQELPAADCEFMGGTFAGAETTCVSTACPQPPTGACCYYPEVSCAEMNAFDCDLSLGTWYGAGTTCDDVTCPQPPRGDLIAEPFVIPTLPYLKSASTVGFDNWYDEVCDFSAAAPDVVHAYTPAQDETITITLCAGSDYDTKLFVYENEETHGAPYACNDDACTSPMFPEPWISRLDTLEVSAGNTYYIIVDGWGDSAGNYTLQVYSNTLGVCCLPNGECTESSQLWCTEEGGTWAAGESCATYTCPELPVGACCLPGGLCLANQLEWTCENVFGGVWQGEGTSCGDVDCP